MYVIHLPQLLYPLAFIAFLVHLLVNGDGFLDPTSLEWWQWTVLVIFPLEPFSAYPIDYLYASYRLLLCMILYKFSCRTMDPCFWWVATVIRVT